MHELFRRLAHKASYAFGSPIAFAVAIAAIVGWALSGPFFDYSNTWQLMINTGTTILTFLMVFLIQNTQNRDSRAMQLKLDELIKTSRARNELIDLEEMSDEELDRLHNDFVKVREKRGHRHGQH